jgi:hypothetical protein
MSRIATLLAAGFALLLAALGTAVPAAAQAPDATCTTLAGFVTATQPNLPQPIDAITEVTEMVADCDARVLLFVLRYTVPAEQLPATAFEDARSAFLIGACQQGIAADTGWTLAGEFRAPDGTPTARFDTTAADCDAMAVAAPGQVADYVANVAAAFPSPLVLDETLEITGAQADGTTLVLTVHLGGVLADAATVEADLNSRLAPVLCTTSQVTALFRVGAAIRIPVVDDAGREVLALPLDAARCEALLAFAGPPTGPDPAALAAQCANADAVVADMQAALPIINDDGTETVGVAFDCPTGTLRLFANYAGPVDLYAGPALADRETFHDIQHCALDQLAPGLGVAVVTEVRGADGALLATLTTTPPECDFITTTMVADALPRLSPAALAGELAAIVAANRPQIPARISDTLSLVGMFNGPAVLVVFYALEGTLVPEQIAAFADRVRSQILSTDCVDPNQLQLLRAGASLSYRYSDTNQNALFTVTVTAADCGM